MDKYQVKIAPRVATKLTDTEILYVLRRNRLTAYMVGVMIKRTTQKTIHPDDLHTRLTTMQNAGSVNKVFLISKNAPPDLTFQKVVYEARQIGER